MVYHVASLPYRFDGNGDVEVMLLEPGHGDDGLLAPEGDLIEGLTPQDAAAGEAFEETGVFGRTWARPLGLYETTRQDASDGGEDTSVLVFPMRVKGRLPDWRDRGVRQAHWFDAHDAVELVRDQGLAELIAGFQPPPDVLEIWNQDRSLEVADMETV